MTKRPIVLGALILSLILYLSSFFGVSDAVPRFFFPEGSRLRLTGRVVLRESMTYGTRLILEECSVLPKADHSENVSLGKQSFTQSFTQSDTNSEAQIKEQSDRIKQNIEGRVQVYLKKETDKIHCGSWIMAEGLCGYPDTATNPGQFDSRKYYQARNMVFQLKEAQILYQWRENISYLGTLSRLREALISSMEKVLGKEEAAVISAITLGKREGMSGKLKRLYQEGGISHILAISSLHITLLGMGIYQLLRKCRWPIGGCCLVSGLLLFSFCIMTGMSISARRAGVMYLLWLGSQVLGRTNDQPTGLGLASFFILLPFPGCLQDSSFLLSFGCVLSLLYVTPLVRRLLPLPGAFGKALQSSAAIQIGTLPLIMSFFYQVTPYAFLVNLAVIPFMELLMLAGLAGSVVGLVSIPAGILVSAPCHYLLKWFEFLCGLERKLPGAVVITGCPEGWQTAVYYGVLFFACRLSIRERGKQRKVRPGIAALAVRTGIPWLGLVLMVAVLSLRNLPLLRITFLDVGQGDGILIQSGSFSCLIDGGSSSETQVWQYRIESTLKYYGISTLNAVLISHGDSDHISGIQELLEGYELGYGNGNVGGITVERLIFPDTGYPDDKLETLRLLAGENGIPVGILKAGGKLCSGKLELTCLYPKAGLATGDSNQDSMVLLLKMDDFTALFTGDLELEGEALFLDACREYLKIASSQADLTRKDPDGMADWNGKLNLLKVAHHGSKNGTSEEFLRLFSPRAAVISCGKDNSYGHPAEEVLDRLGQSGAEIYRTDLSGAVTVEIRDEAVFVETFDGKTVSMY